MISTQIGYLYYFSQYRASFPLSRPNLAMNSPVPRPSSFSVRMPYNHSDSRTIPIHGLASIAANRMRSWPRVHLGGWRQFLSKTAFGAILFLRTVPLLYPPRPRCAFVILAASSLHRCLFASYQAPFTLLIVINSLLFC